jgi:hypothetical protein
MKTIRIHHKRLIGLMVFIFTCFAFSTSCENAEYEYLPPTFLKISGVSSVTVNSTKDYYTFYLDDTDYVWTAPAGASITIGQGTSHITVKFGATSGSGTLSVEAKGIRAEKVITIN